MHQIRTELSALDSACQSPTLCALQIHYLLTYIRRYTAKNDNNKLKHALHHIIVVDNYVHAAETNIIEP